MKHRGSTQTGAAARRATGRKGAAAPAPAEAVLAIAVDNLGGLGELFGPGIAEEVMAEVERRLDAVIPKDGRLTREAGDIFVLSVPSRPPPKLRTLAEALRAAAALDPVETSVGPVGVTVGIGLGGWLGGWADAHGQAGARAGAVPLRQDSAAVSKVGAAYDALREALETGPGAICMAEDVAHRHVQRAWLTNTARAAMQAVNEDRLIVAFQPVVPAHGTGEPAFHECLVRIRDRDGQLTPAAMFVPAIERLGLAPLLDRQVLAKALATLEAHPGVRLSVNIFPQTMQDGAWAAQYMASIARRPELADRLIIEVTESAAMLDPKRTAHFLDQIRETGAAFAIDDFGAGATSLRDLRRFRFDIVKFDGSFVRNIETDLDDRFFLRVLVEVADRFEMMTVAEFVHRPAQARILRDLGIDCFQGFQFGVPDLSLVEKTWPGALTAEV